MSDLNDFLQPTVETNYMDLPETVTQNINRVLTQNVVSSTNIPEGAVIYNRANKRWEEYKNGGWGVLSNNYSINVATLNNKTAAQIVTESTTGNTDYTNQQVQAEAQQRRNADTVLQQNLDAVAARPVFIKNMIIMWGGFLTDIPTGWGLCDGQGGRPNLIDRFIIGAGSTHGIGDIGGSTTATLGTNNMPAHNHGDGSFSGSTDVQGHHAHGFTLPFGPVNNSYSGGGQGNFGGGTCGYGTDGGGEHSHNFSGTVSITTEGGGEAFSILPPYYALAFIIKL
jgi:microcystin-dependent protein